MDYRRFKQDISPDPTPTESPRSAVESPALTDDEARRMGQIVHIEPRQQFGYVPVYLDELEDICRQIEELTFDVYRRLGRPIRTVDLAALETIRTLYHTHGITAADFWAGVGEVLQPATDMGAGHG